MSFIEKQETLVNGSWESVKHNLPHHSVLFYTFKIPTARNMFSFLKDSVEVQNSLKLQAHAEKKFGMVGEVVLEDATLGAIHIQKGVVDPHFVVVKEALLKTMKEAAGDK
ncbi:leghemoglobin Lb120-1 [Medicago truncatula]|uniref:Leghemoglobin Lb120-1 n=1 Tax=Medicago truncatula TaxID=3880 RepID=G7KTR8_MEDTR|nr:leghemoglobin Lb120-1 [Medicago truncatula]